LFSKPALAAFVNASFEPVWVSVRPVPIVRIDFGNGKVLTRTLHGNILTSVCTADGLLLDSLPGIYTEEVYRSRLDQLRLLAGYTAYQRPEKRADFVRGYHQRQAEALARGQQLELLKDQLARAFSSKRRIELPLEVVLSAAKPGDLPAARTAVEKGPTAPEDLEGWKALVEDTELNEKARRQKIHSLLAKEGPVKPGAVLNPIYKDVLHADLDDPYLGLGKVLFASYPFAREDEGK